MKRLLLIEDDINALESTKKILLLEGFEIESSGDGEEALFKVRNSKFDLIITDVRMPKMTGLEFLKALRTFDENIPVIIMTAFGQIQDAVWAMKMGAVDFLTKPFKRQTLLDAVRSIVYKDVANVQSEVETLIGQTPKILELKNHIEVVAPTLSTVLITGESGTGKEVVAKMIHQKSLRAAKSFVAINCAAVPENLIEAELFGYEKGAFTGATHQKIGLIESAHGGTLFLDEIGDLPLSVQPKLLRVLQEQEVRKVGSTRSQRVDVRVIAATHQPLEERVKSGLFRADLFFRLEVVKFEVPPLRTRMEDLPDLCQSILSKILKKHAKTNLELSSHAVQSLSEYSWPGNVRELENALERAVVFSQGDKLEISFQKDSSFKEHTDLGKTQVAFRLGTPLKEVEDVLIRKTLEATLGDKTVTAKLLGINPRTIYRKLEIKPVSSDS